jgi:hypothetical protein
MFILAAGCEDLGEAPAALYTKVDAQRVYLTNTTDDILYYFIVPTEWVPIIDWAPNCDPITATNGILPGNTTSLSFEESYWVKAGHHSSDLTVYWWGLVRRPDGAYTHDVIQSLRVRFGS